MVDYTASRPGQINTAGDETALYLKTFGGEVMVAFEQATKFMNCHFNQKVRGSKSRQFPILGRTSASYHVIGAEITGSMIPSNERVITVDDMLQSNVFVAEWDEMVSHFEVRSKYTTEIARALAQRFDKTIAQSIVLAARASSPITGENGGTVLTDANYSTSGAALAAALFDAVQVFEESEVTGTPRLFIRPAQHALLRETTALYNKDWNGSGSYSEGKIGKINGVEIVSSNNVPSTNINSGPSKYQGNFSTTVGVFATDMAVGSITMQDVAVASEYQLSRLGTLIVGKLAFGAGILRPICAIELKTS